MVTSSADTVNGNANPTLRDAITYANANPGTTITFNSALGNSTVTLASALPIITGNNTSIDGGSNNITVSGDSLVRVFFVGVGASPVSATIANLSIASGKAGGR